MLLAPLLGETRLLPMNNQAVPPMAPYLAGRLLLASSCISSHDKFFPHITHHTSHITHHTSHITHHTSHITH
ncbi:hypothetical protein ADT37_14200 [Yersinia pestis subsp. microtus bv. Caucasica]|nr:hypothetical protein ADT37_14200 [Yersinia pestis subsp. microtus bv. Caucasica]TNV40000.1 hypothetical protein FIN97_14695 [Yersinia pestis]